MAKKKEKEEPFALDLTSMIDVIFLLLIFFMCATKIKKDEKALHMELPLPGPKKGGKPDPNKLQIVIKVLANPKEMEDVGKLRVDLNNRAVRIEDIGSTIKELKGSSTEDPSVQIQALGKIEFNNILAILDVCAMEKITSISMQKITSN